MGPPLNPKHRKQWAYALLFIAPALWSVNYLVGRSAVNTVAPHALAFGRWLIAFLLLAALSWREIAAHPIAIRRGWKQFLVLGALGMWICGAFVYVGARTTVATNIALIYSTSPVMIALMSRFVLKERMGAVQMTGVGLAFAGVLHIVLKGQWRDLAEVQFSVGDAWILAATLSWTAYSLLLKAWPSPFGPAARLTLIMGGGLVVLAPLTLIEALWFMPTQVSWMSFAYILAVALFPGLGAYLAYSYMQRELGAARVGVVLYLGPIYAAAAAWLVLGEPVRDFHWMGAAMILPGIYLSTRPARGFRQARSGSPF
ncbi:MAG: DMT family transporter [Burkholderiales bacterium]|nr:DMT family transporter [Burkholderiales bacterium]